MKKWYIKIMSGDGWGFGIVELTDEDAAIVRSFCAAETPYGEPSEWYGSCRLSEQGYDTYEAALAAIENMM